MSAADKQGMEPGQDRSAVGGVIGLGYVGLPLVVELARSGYRVLGFDVSAAVTEGINRGESHIQDVDAARLRLVTVIPGIALLVLSAVCTGVPKAASTASTSSSSGSASTSLRSTTRTSARRRRSSARASQPRLLARRGVEARA